MFVKLLGIMQKLHFLVGALVFGFILLINVIIVWYHSNANENSLSKQFQTPFVIPIIIIYLIIFFYLFRLSNKYKVSTQHLIRYCLILYFIVMVSIYILFPYEPQFDSATVISLANHLEKTGDNPYLLNYPNNIGFFVVNILLSLASNQLAALAFVNILSGLLIVYSIVRITDLIFDDDRITRFTVVLCAFFVPLYFLVVCYYNDPLGIALSISSVYIALRIMNKWRLKLAVILIILAVLAIFIRENSLIVFITISIVLILSAVNLVNLAKRLVVVMLIFILPVLLVNCVEKGLIAYGNSHNISKADDQKVPAFAFIAMSMITFDDAKHEIPYINKTNPDLVHVNRILPDGWYNLYSQRCTVSLGSDKCQKKQKK